VRNRLTAALTGSIMLGRPGVESQDGLLVQARQRRSSIKRGAVVAAWLLCSAQAEAGPSTCLRELGTTDITLIKSILHLRGVEHAPEDRRCAAYRQHVATVSKVREVFERCLSGAKKDVDLRQLDGALDDANGVMARVCAQ
jgi:hypothetical protein